MKEHEETRRRHRWAAFGWDLYALASLLNAGAVSLILIAALIFMLVIGR